MHRVGAEIVSVDDVWQRSDLVLKVKEPIAVEYPRLREGLILFTYLHIAADEPLTRALIDSGITAIAYETVEVGRSLPLLAPMSEVAGRLAPQAGAYLLEKPLGGRGLLLGGVPGVAPGRVVVVGGGVVGYNAAVIALGLGAQVTILDRSIDRMRHLEEVLSGPRVAADELEPSDRRVRRGCRPRDRRRADSGRGRAEARDARDDRGHEGRRRGRRRRDRPGRLLRDLATTHADPVYVVDGVTHYCVANMPGAVPITSTKALTNATLPYVEAIANKGLRAAVTGRRRAGQGRERDRGQAHVRSRRRGARPRLHARFARCCRSAAV